MSIKTTKIIKPGNGYYSIGSNVKAVQVTAIGAGGGGGSSSTSEKDVLYGSGQAGYSGIQKTELIFIEDLKLVDGSISYSVGAKGVGGITSVKNNTDGADGSSGESTRFGSFYSAGGLGGKCGICNELNQSVISSDLRTFGASGSGAVPNIKDGSSNAGLDGKDGALFIVEYTEV